MNSIRNILLLNNVDSLQNDTQHHGNYDDAV